MNNQTIEQKQLYTVQVSYPDGHVDTYQNSIILARGVRHAIIVVLKMGVEELALKDFNDFRLTPQNGFLGG